MGKYVFERYFDGNDQKNANLAPLIDCHDLVGNQIYTVVLSIVLNSFPSMCLSMKKRRSMHD